MRAEPKACGTDAGFTRHRRRREQPCDDCRAAHRIADAAWKRTVRADPTVRSPCIGCGRPRKRQDGARGWCHTCYQRWLYHGNPDVPPSRDVDEMAVERAVFGDRPGRLTTAEREQVVRRLNRIGFSDRRIAEHLDIGDGGVFRIRKRLGLSAVPPERRAA